MERPTPATGLAPRSGDRRGGAGRDAAAAGRAWLCGDDHRPDRHHGRGQQARRLPPMEFQGAAGARGALPGPRTRAAGGRFRRRDHPALPRGAADVRRRRSARIDSRSAQRFTCRPPDAPGAQRPPGGHGAQPACRPGRRGGRRRHRAARHQRRHHHGRHRGRRLVRGVRAPRSRTSTPRPRNSASWCCAACSPDAQLLTSIAYWAATCCWASSSFSEVVSIA